jgi:long-chain fatty acid transport protein
MKHKIIPAAIGLMSAMAATSVSASGFAIIENSASGMGNAFAGGAAGAEDASTIWFNPAGMTRLNNEIVGALHVILPDAQFTDENSTSALGGALDPTNTDKTGETNLPGRVPNFYWVKKLDEEFTFGLGINAPFGLATEYQDDWIGRYHAVASDTVSVNINPSIAYKSGQLSLGFGINAQYMDVILSSAVDLGSACVGAELASQIPAGTCASVGASPQGSDGFADLNADGWSYSYNLGLLYELSEDARIGVAYRSGFDQTVNGHADFTVPGNLAFLTASGNFTDTTITGTVTLPSVLSVSYFQNINEKIALMADVSLTSWSNFDELRIVYDSAQPDSATTEDWHDTTRVSFGMNYRASEKWLYRFGVAYDESPIPSAERRTPRIPGNDRTWLSLGFTHQIEKDMSYSVGYAHLFIDDAAINNTYEAPSAPVLEHTLNGNYEISIDILSVQMTWNY